MDGENNGKPYEQMDELEGKNPYFWNLPHLPWYRFPFFGGCDRQKVRVS